MNCELGIDKLHLFAEHFEVSDLTPWNVKPNSKRAGDRDIQLTPLLAVKGETVYGQSIHIHAPDYVADIKHNRLHIQLNPSKMFHPYHLVSDADMLAESINRVQQHLREHMQTDVELFSAGMSRLDVTAQAEMSKPVPAYDGVILSVRDMKRAPRTQYPHGFLIGNRTRQVCTYDKGLKHDQDNGVKSPTASKHMRVETRILKPGPLRQYTPFATVADLLAADKRTFSAVYSKISADLLRIDQGNMPSMDIYSIADLLRMGIQQHGKTHALWYVVSTLMYSADRLPTPGQIYDAYKILQSEGVSSTNTANNNVKRYEQIVRNITQGSKKYHKSTRANIADLHSEFMDKFILPYRIAL